MLLLKLSCSSTHQELFMFLEEKSSGFILRFILGLLPHLKRITGFSAKKGRQKNGNFF